MEETGAAEAIGMEAPPSPTAMAISGSCVVEIPTDMTLSHDDGERFPGEISMVPVRPQRHSIYRVPEYMKDMTNRDAYRPQVVSLGPFHYGEPPLKPMEAHKQRAVAHMVSRSGKPRQEFTAAVEGIAEQLRGAYENLGEEWSGERFVELMVTDGCFLLEVMTDEVEVQGYGSDDPVFSKHGRLYLYSYIISDMLLVENQLPLLLLQKLTLVADPDTEDDRGINHRVLDLLSYTTTPTAPTTPVDEFLGLHPLDVLQKSVRGTRQYRQRPIGDGHMPSAAELREAGIHFKVSTGEGFAGTVSFERGVLRVPKIFLYDDAERMFLNLMAFEQLRPGAGNEVTAFVSFMDDLINTAKDVRLLRAKEIIESGLGSDEAVANLINNTLTKGSVMDEDSSLNDVMSEVDAYCKMRRNRWRAILLHTYFSNPWVFISLVAATVLLIATVIQTVYAILMEETEANAMESPPSPTTVMANSGSCVVDMDRMVSHDNSSEPSSGEKSMVRRHSIYRVPAYIKNMTNQNAYRPQMVSLGPFHYGERPLKPMEEHKQRAVAHVVSRRGRPRQEFIAAVEEIAEELRGAYDQLGEEWSGERFVELMVTDGCFLLEMMATFLSDGEVEGYAPDDPVFSKHGDLYLRGCIISDMLVIENQLPLQLLRKLMFVADPENFEILLYDNAERMFLNLMAFEKLHPGTGNEVTTFVYFMDELINTARDVQLLKAKGIIKHGLGSDEAVANLINNTLTKGAAIDPESSLIDVMVEVDAYCKKPWNICIIILRTKYFSNPWAFISLVASTVLLIATVIQTVYAILSFNSETMEETGAAEANVVESPPSPTTAMANSGSCVVDMDRMVSHDNGSEPSSGEKSMVRRHSIYRVPEYMKGMSNRDAYRPQVVSLGPFHYGEPLLKPMEAHKQRAVAHMVSRSGKPRQEFTAAVEEIAEQLRAAYEDLDEERWSGEEFVKLMVTDGCFLLQAMRTFRNDGEVEGYGSDDPVFSKHDRLYLSSYIISDMLVVENQLPMPLLQKLAFVADLDTFKDHREINRRVIDLLSYSYTITPTTSVDELGLHPLDVLQKSVRGSPNVRRSTGESPMPSAAELHEAGIRFKVSKGSRFAGTVSFERGVLHVPKILLYGGASSMFLNLMAFEKLHPGVGNEVTAFVFFMDELINTAKDVQLLKAKEIIDHGMGSDEAVADLINNTLTTGSVMDQDSSLNDVMSEVDAYCKMRRNRWRAILLHTYFSNPWVFISLVAATVLLIATVIQTVYAILSFNKTT
uniref:Uncharacterized protein n=1 Tax=Oryza meridionalis TaxID=40149 RepID=A0A0E0F6B2_9ORYZ